MFNSKASPLIADVVVGFSYLRRASRFVVMPVAFAEALCRFHCDYWAKVPMRNGKPRSPEFPIYLRFTDEPRAHRDHHARVKQNLEKYEDAWHLLAEPVWTCPGKVESTN